MRMTAQTISNTGRNVLSVFKGTCRGNLVIGHMQSEDFGVPSSVHQFSEGWEYILSRGMFFRPRRTAS